MRPGLHLSNCAPITPADEDIVRRWAPLSALLAMNNIVEDDEQIDKLIALWEMAGRPLLVLRKYIDPETASKPAKWRVHATESILMARRCMTRGVPAGKIALKPFNEPNMPDWADSWEGFGDKPEQIEKYGQALNAFIDVAKNEEPEVLIGGPHLTVGNHDVRFPNDPEGRYYYGPNSLCQSALDRLDLHFVHCYGFRQGQYADPAHGLRFLEYEKFFSGKPVYIVEGCYGIQTADGGSIDPAQNQVRGQDTVAYLQLLDQYPQVKGITLWIGGNAGWQEHRHSDGADPGSHRPVVFHVEQYAAGEPIPEPVSPEDPISPDGETIPEPQEPEEVEMKAYYKDGTEADPEALLGAYAVTIDQYDGPGYHVAEIRERCEAANCDVWVKDNLGNPIIDIPVRWGWPGTEVEQRTGYDGRVGFAMAHSAYYDPATGHGPHWTAVTGDSDLVEGIGMVSGTVHCTLNFVFQYGEGNTEPEPSPESEPEPPPQPEPEPEPEPDPEVEYTFLAGLSERLSKSDLAGPIDMRPQIKAISDVSSIATREFGQITTIVVHHTGSNGAQSVLGLAELHINEREWPTIGYHIVIGFGGEVWFAAPFKWIIHDCGELNPEVIGIGVMGDFTSQPPGGKQVLALRCVIQEIWRFLGGGWDKCRPTHLLPHSHLSYLNKETCTLWHTACPGALKRALIWASEWPGGGL